METPTLFTDRYEFQMAAALSAPLARRRCVFEVFARSLSAGRAYGVAVGLGRFLEALARFEVSRDDVDWLVAEGVVPAASAEAFVGLRFTGDVAALPEGEVYFPGTPIVRVEGTFAECALLETVLLSIMNADSSAASTAARMAVAAEGRTLIEMGSRRTNEHDAVAVARAAYIAGFAATSNLAAGRRYGVPTAGTVAHAFILAHDSEADAFAAQVSAQGADTTLLVDTYDLPTGVETAVAVAGTGLGAVRIDSGPLAENCWTARRILDRLGATGTGIVASGDLDEQMIAALVAGETPVDRFGVGTRLVAGAGRPAPGFVYKLVAIAESDAPGAPLRPVAKRQHGKATVGGRKHCFRRYEDGVLVDEILTLDDIAAPSGYVSVLVPYVVAGGLLDKDAVGPTGVQAARIRCAAALAALPLRALSLEAAGPFRRPQVLGAVPLDDLLAAGIAADALSSLSTNGEVAA